MRKLLKRVVVLAAAGAAVGYVVRRWMSRSNGTRADAGEPEGTWGLERSGLTAGPDGAR
jgi:hypothetical protein